MPFNGPERDLQAFGDLLVAQPAEHPELPDRDTSGTEAVGDLVGAGVALGHPGTGTAKPGPAGTGDRRDVVFVEVALRGAQPSDGVAPAAAQPRSDFASLGGTDGDTVDCAGIV
jgi:hypothetical protein